MTLNNPAIFFKFITFLPTTLTIHNPKPNFTKIRKNLLNLSTLDINRLFSELRRYTHTTHSIFIVIKISSAMRRENCHCSYLSIIYGKICFFILMLPSCHYLPPCWICCASKTLWARGLLDKIWRNLLVITVIQFFGVIPFALHKVQTLFIGNQSKYNFGMCR